MVILPEDGSVTLLDALANVNSDSEKSVVKLSGPTTTTGIGTKDLSADASGVVNFELDLNGQTLTIEKNPETGQFVGSAGTPTNAMQLLKDSNITIKGGTIRAPEARMLIQNYSNLTLEDVVVDGSGNNTYALSNNFGEIHLKGDTVIRAAEGQVAFDLWYGLNKDGLYDDGVTVYIDDPTVVIEGIIEFGMQSRSTITNWVANTHLYVCKDYPDVTSLKVVNSTAASKDDSELVWVDIGDWYEIKRTKSITADDVVVS